MRFNKVLRLLLYIGLTAFLNRLLHASCGSPANPIEAENCLTGNPASEWDLPSHDAGDLSIQGFATDISINAGETVRFKINTNADGYTIDIYRIGFYGGSGARKVASVIPSAALPQAQPTCLTETTGLVDCGNWAESASWDVPSTAVSGVYFARLKRTDTNGASHIVFIVRNDGRNADVLFQTSDTTWQAYNTYGGNSLYVGNGAQGRAYKVSYNRPFITRTNYSNWVFTHEYPMIRWLESNGYDVTYFSGIDTERRGSLLLNHKTYLSVGHDEYWSKNQRTAVENAQAAGIHMMFLSSNEMYWKTRWENSIDGADTPYRTLVCYKESYDVVPTDPQDPPTWTGTWRDPRLSPPADGGRPENQITGQIYMVNAYRQDAIVARAEHAPLRFWRNTAVAGLTGNSILSFPETVGYEWDEDVDNGFRPPGLMRLSSATYAVGSRVIDETGTNYQAGFATHHLTLFRKPSGALIFGAGTMQWSWGLDNNHDQGQQLPPVLAMQQAMVNLFADMGVQPATLRSGLVAASASTDATPPASVITFPLDGQTVENGHLITISGTASDAAGRIGGVEVSVDNGTSWRPATGRESWFYEWTPHPTDPAITIKTRAVDDSANLETPGTGVTVSTSGTVIPDSIWPATTVPFTNSQDTSIEVGLKFRSDIAGYIKGVRFYKDAFNTGVHIGNLWTTSGVRLASGTFTGETPTGWQQMLFATPVEIQADTTYVVSYFTTKGYAVNQLYFTNSGYDRPPLHALRSGVDGPNGLFIYTPTSAFPNGSWKQSNYWVDVVFSTSIGPINPVPVLTSISPETAEAGSGGFTLTANGSDFTPASVVYWNGSPRSTVVIDSTKLTATVLASDVAAAGTAAVTIVSPAPGGGTSASKTFIIEAGNNPVPILASLSPAVATAGGATFTLNLAGSQFASNAVVRWNGEDRSTAFISSVSLRAVIPAVDIVSTGTVQISVFNPAPGGGTSEEKPFTISPLNVFTTLWSASTGAVAGNLDANSLEVGVKFRSDIDGVITAVRFYKNSFNTGSHQGSLWTGAGVRLASVTFTGETASGWQQMNFSTPVAISAATTYVASIFTRTGYGADRFYFLNNGVDTPPLHALKSGVDGNNGVYTYSTASVFPVSSTRQSNYWVDVVFATAPVAPNNPAPVLTDINPVSTAAGGASFTLNLTGSHFVSGSVVRWNGSDRSTTFVNAGNLTAVVPASDIASPQSAEITVFNPAPGGGISAVKTFIVYAPNDNLFVSLWSTSTVPGTLSQDPNIEVGVKFRSDAEGYIHAIKFYKHAFNTGTHVGSLWTSTGVQLSSVVFTNETATGWQRGVLPVPIAINANTTYVASYHTTKGYGVNQFYFTNTGVDTPPLRGLKSGVDGNNGLYKYSAVAGVFPNGSYRQSNYWVDVVFSTSPAPIGGFSLRTIPRPVFKNLSKVHYLTDEIIIDYPAGYDLKEFEWEIARMDNQKLPSDLEIGISGGHEFSTAPTEMSLKLAALKLKPGLYHIEVKAVSNSGQTSGGAEAQVTLFAVGTGTPRVFPSPWRADRDAMVGITFDGLALEGDVQIFTLASQRVRTLKAVGGIVTWDRKNDDGKDVASGIYLFLAKGANGEDHKGKFAIIK